MPATAHNVAQRYGIAREDADRFAVRSQQRAGEARYHGRFQGEIVHVGEVVTDETIRKTTLEGLARLRDILIRRSPESRPATRVP